MKIICHIYSISLMLLSCEVSMAQFDSPLGAFPSPDAAAINMYGEVPADHYTGVPVISIPIHEFKYGNISVPVTLNYHSASVKPNIHPGCVGLGWSLFAGGMITRQVNGDFDELKNSSNNVWVGYMGNYSKLDIGEPEWHNYFTLESFKNYLFKSRDIDMMADEFSFNFGQYSGKFYLNHKGEWVVQSDHHIKVLLDPDEDCIGIKELRKDIVDRMRNAYYPMQIYNRVINRIRLVTPDGFVYEFGGIDATEYSVNYFGQTNSPFGATSWMLSSITSPEEWEVRFKYTPGKPVCEIAPIYSQVKVEKMITIPVKPKNDTQNTFNGFLILPVYLTRIEAGFGNTDYIDFYVTKRGDLKIPNSYLRFTHQRGLSLFTVQDRIDQIIKKGWISPEDPQKDLEWMKLDSLAISNRGIERSLHLKYLHEYQRRLRLSAITDKQSGKDEYRFTYFEGMLPSYCTDRIDHWGFYNGSTASSEQIYADPYQYQYTRHTAYSDEDAQTEVLKRITYPTGGHTEFEYEKNKYKKYVNETNQVLLEPINQNAGGIRIKQIKNFEKDGVLSHSKSYYYVSGLNSLSDTASAVSSGVLSAKPRYILNYQDNYMNTKCELFNSGALNPYINNANGSQIGYSEVIEVNKNERNETTGYTKFTYSNFDNDIWGEDHRDDSQVSNAWMDESFSLCPRSSRSFERGKIMSEEYFSDQNKLMKSVRYKYARQNNDQYVRGVWAKQYTIGASYSPYHDLILDNTQMFGAFKFYLGCYKPIEIITSDYLSNSTNPITLNTKLKYDNFYQVSEQTIERKNGDKEVTHIYYPYNFRGTTVMEQMIEINKIASPIEITVDLVNGGISKFLKKEQYNYIIHKHKYAPPQGFPVLSSYDLAVKNKDRMRTMYSCDLFDKRGNPLFVRLHGQPESVYLWDYTSQYPLAEIKNADYDSVYRILVYPEGYFAEELLELVDDLRSALPDSEIRIFDYESGLRNWEMDARGLIQKYRYNYKGQLLKTLDHDNYILRMLKYEFLNK